MTANEKYINRRIVKTDWISTIRDWRKISGHRKRRIINNSLGCEDSPLQVVEYKIYVPSKYGINGKSLFLFSDIHYTEQCEAPDVYLDVIGKVKPDWILFGGDLITYASQIKGAFEWLERVSANFASIPKIAIPGNWDRRRGRWFPQRIWNEKYKECGFHYLVNQEIIIDGVRFYGVDDLRGGYPEIEPRDFDSKYFNCLVSHSVESVVDVVGNGESFGDNIVLCGHSHGGQIRIPFFGALLTSTKYWKFFEYGHYKNRKAHSELVVTSGVGTSRFPFRILCPPEVVVIKFVNNPEK